MQPAQHCHWHPKQCHHPNATTSWQGHNGLGTEQCMHYTVMPHKHPETAPRSAPSLAQPTSKPTPGFSWCKGISLPALQLVPAWEAPPPPHQRYDVAPGSCPKYNELQKGENKGKETNMFSFPYMACILNMGSSFKMTLQDQALNYFESR